MALFADVVAQLGIWRLILIRFLILLIFSGGIFGSLKFLRHFSKIAYIVSLQFTKLDRNNFTFNVKPLRKVQIQLLIRRISCSDPELPHCTSSTTNYARDYMCFPLFLLYK